MTQVVDILNQARAYIIDPARWTTGTYARSADGETAWAPGPDAVCWCALGALGKATYFNNEYSNTLADEACNLLNEASLDLYDRYISDVNDQMGHFEVLKVYARAIEMAK